MKVIDVLKRAEEIMQDSKRAYHHAREVHANLHDAAPDAEVDDPFADVPPKRAVSTTRQEQQREWDEARRLARDGAVDNAAEARKILDALSAPQKSSSRPR